MQGLALDLAGKEGVAERCDSAKRRALSAPTTATTRRSPRRCSSFGLPDKLQLLDASRTHNRAYVSPAPAGEAQNGKGSRMKIFSSILFFCYFPGSLSLPPPFILGSCFSSLRLAQRLFALQTRDATCGPFLLRSKMPIRERERERVRVEKDYLPSRY